MSALFQSAQRNVSQAGRKVRAAAERPELLRNVRSRERRKQREIGPLSSEEKASQNKRTREMLPIARGILQTAGGSVTPHKIRAISASGMCLWLLCSLWFIQFLFWIMGFVGVAVEVAPILDIILPGKEIYLASYVFIVLLGLFSMFYVAFVYSVRGVQWFKGMRGLAFAASLTGYFVFFLNLFPWIALWMLVVIFSKPEEQQ